MVRSERIVRRCSSTDKRIEDCGSEVHWNWFCILNQKERILLIPQVNCGSELLDVVWHPEPETSYPADPPKCTQAEFDPPKCTEAEIDPPKGRFSAAFSGLVINSCQLYAPILCCVFVREPSETIVNPYSPRSLIRKYKTIWLDKSGCVPRRDRIDRLECVSECMCVV